MHVKVINSVLKLIRKHILTVKPPIQYLGLDINSERFGPE